MLIKVGTQIKIAATSNSIEELVTADKTATKVLEAKQPDFLYFRARAISAGDQGPVAGEPNPNGNGDYFPRKELEAAYQTFVGKNLFLNHESDHPLKSVGKIVDAYAVDDPETGEFYIECLSKIDRKLHPEIARKVETGELNTVSMGCSCQQSVCSICGTTIHSDLDAKCEHLSGKGLLHEFEASVDLPDYGIKKGNRLKAFSINSGLGFNELSIVNVPADCQATIKTVIANIKQQLTKTGSLKEAEKQDITTQLDELLTQLDPKMQEQIRAEFCNVSTKEAAASDEQEIKQILKKLDGFEFMRLSKHFEKTPKKIAEKEERDVNLDQLVSKVVNTLAGKLFAQTVRRTAQEALEKHAAEKCTLCGKECDKCEGGLCPDCILRRKHEKKVSFIKHDDLKLAAWVVTEGDQTLLTAALGDVWEDELEANKDWAISEEYGQALLAQVNELGLEKTSELLGLKKEAKETKLDKEVQKSYKKFNKEDEKPAGSHLEDSKPESVKEAAQIVTSEHPIWVVRNPSKSSVLSDTYWKAEDTESLINTINGAGYSTVLAESWSFYDNEAEARQDAEQRLSKGTNLESKQEDKPMLEKVASAFDKVEKILLAQDHVAVKDKETGEIVISDKEGKEVRRLPDAFGDDIPSIMKLLHAILNIEEPLPEDKKEEVIEEKVEEEVEEVKEEVGEIEDKEASLELDAAGKKRKKVMPKRKEKVLKEDPKVEEKPIEGPKEEPKVEEIVAPPVVEEVKEEPVAPVAPVVEDMPKVEIEPTVTPEPEAVTEVKPAEPMWYSVTIPAMAADKVNDWLIGKNFELLSFGSDLSSYLGKMTEAELGALKKDLADQLGANVMKDVSVRTFMSREAALRAVELLHKEAELKAREAALLKKEADIKAAQLANIVSARTITCRQIIEAMVERDLLTINEDDVETELLAGASVIDARKVAFEKATNIQLKALLAMDDTSLKAFSDGVYHVKKQASKKLSLPINLTLPTETGVDQDLKKIFNSMG